MMDVGPEGAACLQLLLLLHARLCVSAAVVRVSACVHAASPTKSNYHWKVAALLANAKCFVLLRCRLIG